MTPLYQQPAFLAASGGALRPGGPELTRRGLALCGLEPGSRILDVGCGSGASLRLLRELGFAGEGVDPDPHFVVKARAAGLNARQGSAQCLPAPDAAYDGALCECVLSLLPDPDAALAEIARVLRPGGALALSDLYARGPDIRPAGAQSGQSCLAGAVTLEEMADRLERNGFTVLDCEDHSRALAEFAGRLMFAGWERPACGAGARPGYALFAARLPIN